jgi:hypothetical protein
MPSLVETLRNNITELERQLDAQRYQLADIINNCSHKWSVPVSDDLYQPGYKIPGGVDHQCDCYVEPRTPKQWKRTCSICGVAQWTTTIQKEVIDHPKFY